MNENLRNNVKRLVEAGVPEEEIAKFIQEFDKPTPAIKKAPIQAPKALAESGIGGPSGGPDQRAIPGMPAPVAARQQAMKYALEMASNIPASGASYLKNVLGTITHPVQTAETLGQMASGGTQFALKKAGIINDIRETEAKRKFLEASRGIGQRYGSLPNIAETIRVDPVGVIGDLSMLASGGAGALRGAGALGHISQFPRAGAALSRAGSALNRAGYLLEPANAAGRSFKLMNFIKRAGKKTTFQRVLNEPIKNVLNKSEINEMIELGNRYGIDLSGPQILQSKSLADVFNLLGDTQKTAPAIQKFRKIQQQQISNAIYDFFEEISPLKQTRKEAGSAIVQAADKEIQRLRKVRTELARPAYAAAMKTRGVDISDTITKIDDLLSAAPEGGVERRAILRVKKMLHHTIEEGGKKHFVPVDQVKVLDKVKKEINSQWKKDPKNAPTKQAQATLREILDSMLHKVDQDVPEYAAARQIYKTASPWIEAHEKGMVGQLRKLDGEKVAQAGKRLFDSIDSSPETVTVSKKLIQRQSPEAWNGALKGHLREIFEKQKESAGGVDTISNIGGMFYKRTYGDPRQRAILKAAMSDAQFDNFEKLSKVLNTTGMILRKESATATRQQLQRQITGINAGQLIAGAMQPKQTWSTIAEKFDRYKFEVNAEKMADLLTATPEKFTDTLNDLANKSEDARNTQSLNIKNKFIDSAIKFAIKSGVLLTRTGAFQKRISAKRKEDKAIKIKKYKNLTESDVKQILK